MSTKTESPALEITRLIKAPRHRVYEAWTDPTQLPKWFGPENVQTLELTAEVRVGGKYRWDLMNPEGEKKTCEGEYRELVPDRKIVFTWQWQDDENWESVVSVVTVELDDAEDGTELRLRHEGFPNDTSRENHRQGWNSVLDRLENFCRAS